MNTRRLGLLLCGPILLGGVACFQDPGNPFASSGETSGDGDGDETRGDGDGDGAPGDGDGTPGDGDGVPGDGDGAHTGDGDGMPGDGDGDNPCGPGEMMCGTGCTDTSIDNANCGDCGVECLPFTLCGEGTCKPEKYVFVTNQRYAGNIGGPAQADSYCTTTATLNNLPGVYRAWLSTGTVSPSQWNIEDGVYKLRGNPPVVVAYSWADLRDGTLAAPINRTETGEMAQQSPACSNSILYGVWTGTSENGTSMGPECAMWMNNGMSSMGRVGDASRTDPWWTNSTCAATCDTMLPIYCIQL
jgi:hypothetical protein